MNDGSSSQRQISKNLGLSIGKVNYCPKEVIRNKGNKTWKIIFRMIPNMMLK